MAYSGMATALHAATPGAETPYTLSSVQALCILVAYGHEPPQHLKGILSRPAHVRSNHKLVSSTKHAAVMLYAFCNTPLDKVLPWEIGSGMDKCLKGLF